MKAIGMVSVTLAVLVMALTSLVASAQPAPIGAADPTKVLTAVSRALGGGEWSGADPEGTLDQVRLALETRDVDPGAALNRIRQAVGLASQPAQGSDKQAANFLAMLILPQADVPPVATLFLPVQANSHPDPQLLERSFLLPLSSDQILEAQIAPHIFLWDNTENLYSKPTAERKHFWAGSWSFTPMIHLRILDIESGPIKTLSWMPKTDFVLTRLKRAGPAPSQAPEQSRAWSLHFTVGHHSNGQDECTFLPGVLSRDELCPEPQRVEDVRINYPNGSFSTNYVRVGIARKVMRLETIANSQRSIRSSLTAALYVETHPAFLKIGGTLPDVLRDLYGRNRFMARLEYERAYGSNPLVSDEPTTNEKGSRGSPKRTAKRGSFRLTTTLEFIDKIPKTTDPTAVSRPNAPLNALYDPKTGSSRWRLVGEGAWNPDLFRGWGLIARYFHGQDDYNLLFFRDIDRFQVGVVFDAGEFKPFN